MTNAKQKKMIVGGAFAAGVLTVLLGGYVMVISPKQAKAAELQRAVAAYQSKLTLAQAVARHPSPRADIDVSDLFRLSKAMPDRADTAGAILDLVAAANATGVRIDGLNEPAGPVPATNGGSEQTVEIDATLHGRYGQLTSFLGRVRRLVAFSDGAVRAQGRLFSVDSIVLAADPANSTTLKATVNFETYVYAVGAPASATPTTTPTPTGQLSAAGASN